MRGLRLAVALAAPCWVGCAMGFHTLGLYHAAVACFVTALCCGLMVAIWPTSS